jgi:hypothetical protein
MKYKIQSFNYINIEIKSKRMRRMGYIARIGELRNAYKSFVGKSIGERQQEVPV